MMDEKTNTLIETIGDAGFSVMTEADRHGNAAVEATDDRYRFCMVEEAVKDGRVCRDVSDQLAPILNQFGDQTLEVKHPGLRCVPSEKIAFEPFYP
jgi:hypothetical protein